METSEDKDDTKDFLIKSQRLLDTAAMEYEASEGHGLLQAVWSSTMLRNCVQHQKVSVNGEGEHHSTWLVL